MLHTRRAFFALVAVLAIASVACSNDSSTSSSSAAGSSSDADTGATVNATVKDFAIAVDPAEIAGGEITFSISNEGPSAHEFVVIETDDAPGDLPVEDGEVTEDGLNVIGEAEDIAPSTSADPLTLTLPAGDYVIICNLPGHYQQGMTTGLKVT